MRRNLLGTTVYYSPSDMSGGAQGGGQQQQPQNGQQNGQQGQQGQQNQDPPKPKTASEKMAEFAQLWDKKAPEQQNNQNNNNNNQQQQQQPQNGNKLEGFLKDQKYFDGIDPYKFAQAMNSGDQAQIMPMMQQVMSNMHQIMLANMDKFGQHYYSKAKTEALGEFSTSYNADKAYTELFSRKAELALPAVQPMAKATFNQLLSKGATKEEAITKTIEFFDAMGGNFTKPPENIGGRAGSAPQGYSQDGAGKQTAIDYEALWAQE